MITLRWILALMCVAALIAYGVMTCPPYKDEPDE